MWRRPQAHLPRHHHFRIPGPPVGMPSEPIRPSRRASIAVRKSRAAVGQRLGSRGSACAGRLIVALGRLEGAPDESQCWPPHTHPGSATHWLGGGLVSGGRRASSRAGTKDRWQPLGLGMVHGRYAGTGHRASPHRHGLGLEPHCCGGGALAGTEARWFVVGVGAKRPRPVGRRHHVQSTHDHSNWNQRGLGGRSRRVLSQLCSEKGRHALGVGTCRRFRRGRRPFTQANRCPGQRGGYFGGLSLCCRAAL